jgi:hypothetical protein
MTSINSRDMESKYTPEVSFDPGDSSAAGG